MIRGSRLCVEEELISLRGSRAGVGSTLVIGNSMGEALRWCWI